MKKRYLAVMGLTMLLTACATGGAKVDNPISELGDVEDNLLDNGSFTEKYDVSIGNDYEGIGTWGVYGMAGGKGHCSQNDRDELVVTVDKYGITDYSIQLGHKGVLVIEESEYTLSFDVYGKKTQTATVIVQKDGGNYDAYFEQDFKIEPGVNHYEYNFTCPKTDTSAAVVFNMGLHGNEKLTTNEICYDNITFLCTKDSGKYVPKRQNIVLNQIGFFPDARKQAVFRGITKDSSYKIVNTETEEVVYTGSVGESVYDKPAKDYVARVDFSDLKTPGTYKIVGEISGTSYPFTIGDNIYDKTLKDSFNFLYTQRCGTKVLDDNVGHEACHTDTATIYGSTAKIDVTGGWHDAGDYGKYIVAGAKTVADLLLADDLYGNIYDAQGLDLLEEAKYELDWMLKMQREDGQVYHKVSSYEFPKYDTLMCDDDLPMVVSPVSYAATADFAAVMAMAAMSYKDDEASAKKYKDAAIKAYAALANMNKVTFTNPSDIFTGEYPDEDLDDELLWASAELYKLTNETKYLDAVTATFYQTDDISYGWANMIGFAYYEIAQMTSIDISNTALDKLKGNVTKGTTNIDASGYDSPIGEKYFWGSNLDVCNYAINMLLVDKATGTDNTDYLYRILDYLMGMNPTEYCYVTGQGTKSPIKPHHRPSIGYRYVVPGMLVGGPNNDFKNNGGDSIATTKLKREGAMAAYIDHNNSWSTNEVTIYWNSPFVFMLAGSLDKYSDK